MSYTDPASILVPVVVSLVPHQLLSVYNTNDEYFEAQITALAQAGSTIHGKYYRATAWTTSASGTVPFDTLLWANGISFAGNEWTVATAGYYLVTARGGCTSGGSSQSFQLNITQNSSAEAGGSVTVSVGAAQNLVSFATTVLHCAVNDTIYSTYTTTASLAGTTGIGQAITVDWIGPY